MKIIIFLVLAGFSLAQETIDCPETPTPKNRQACFIKALKGGSVLKKSFKTFLCNSNRTVDQNDEKNLAAGRDLIKGLACAGCSPKDFLEQGYTFEDVYRDSSRIVSEIPLIVLNIEDAIGPTPALRNFICKLDGRNLETQCFIRLSLFIKNNASELQRINDLYCENEINKLSSDQIFEFMKKLGCFGPVTRDASIIILKDRDENVVKKAISKVVYDLLVDLIVRQKLKPCPVSDTEKALSDDEPLIVAEGDEEDDGLYVGDERDKGDGGLLSLLESALSNI